jgi:hypothetical protein
METRLRRSADAQGARRPSVFHYGARGQTVGSRRSVTNDLRPAWLLGSNTIRVAQGFALFQSPSGSCGEPDLAGNGLAAVAPVLNDKFLPR